MKSALTLNFDYLMLWNIFAGLGGKTSILSVKPLSSDYFERVTSEGFAESSACHCNWQFELFDIG